jgi:hypothetical protein
VKKPYHIVTRAARESAAVNSPILAERASSERVTRAGLSRPGRRGSAVQAHFLRLSADGGPLVNGQVYVAPRALTSLVLPVIERRLRIAILIYLWAALLEDTSLFLMGQARHTKEKLLWQPLTTQIERG